MGCDIVTGGGPGLMTAANEGARRGANVRSVAYSIVYSMSNRDLAPVMDRFAPLKAAIERTADARG